MLNTLKEWAIWAGVKIDMFLNAVKLDMLNYGFKGIILSFVLLVLTSIYLVTIHGAGAKVEDSRGIMFISKIIGNLLTISILTMILGAIIKILGFIIK